MTSVRLTQAEMKIITGPVDTDLDEVKRTWFDSLKGLMLAKGLSAEQLAKPCQATELWPSGDIVLEFSDEAEPAAEPAATEQVST